jgi:hypothetical protein
MVGDEPFARCWVVAVYLQNESQMQQPIDTDPLSPHGCTPHPMPSPPLRWLGLGSPPPPCRDRGNDQEGSGSCVHGHLAHSVPVAPLSRQDMNFLVNHVVTRQMADRVVVGPATPPASTMVRLNFEVFVDIYRYCAYDPTAFGGFFLSLSNVILGHHNNHQSVMSSNLVYDVTQQAETGERKTCVVQEIQTTGLEEPFQLV